MGDYRYRLSFRAWHPTADLAAIAARLGLVATHAWKMGEPRVGPRGRDLGGIRPESYCAIKMGEGLESVHIGVRAALDVLDPHQQFLGALSATRRREVDGGG